MHHAKLGVRAIVVILLISTYYTIKYNWESLYFKSQAEFSHSKPGHNSQAAHFTLITEGSNISKNVLKALSIIDIRKLPSKLDYFNNKGMQPSLQVNDITCFSDDAINNTVLWLHSDVKAARVNNLVYRHPHARQLSGKRLAVHDHYVINTMQPLVHGAMKLSDVRVNEFVFATAASSNHYDECVTSLHRLQQLFPQRPVIFYNLGLTSSEADQVLLINLYFKIKRSF